MNNTIFTEAFGTTWTKQYCTYQKEKKEFTMIPYNQLTGKFVSECEEIIIDQCNVYCADILNYFKYSFNRAAKRFLH